MRCSTTVINHRETGRNPRLVRLAPILILFLIAQFSFSGCKPELGTDRPSTPGDTTVPGDQLPPPPGTIEPTPNPSAEATAPPVVEASPTPQGLVLLIGAEAGPDVKGALQTWAEGRGWSVREAPAGASEEWGDLPGLKAAVGVGPNEAVLGWEEAYPGVPLVIVEQPDARPSEFVSTVGGPGARHDQAAFLAGVMTGLASRSWVVAYVGGAAGEWGSVYRSGFIHGVRYGCPRCGIYETWPSITPKELRSDRVDAVFVEPGTAAAETAASMVVAGFSVFWAGEPPGGFPVEDLSGRVAFAPEVLVVEALEALLSGEEGHAWPYAIENDGLRLASLKEEVITPGRQRVLQAAWDALASGELEIGIDPSKGH